MSNQREDEIAILTLTDDHIIGSEIHSASVKETRWSAFRYVILLLFLTLLNLYYSTSFWSTVLNTSDSAWPLIPRIIHVSMEGDKNCRIQNPRWNYRILEKSSYDWKSGAITKTVGSSLEAAYYPGLEHRVELYDLWRYHIVNKMGGVYLDSDVYCLRPIRDWLRIYGFDHYAPFTHMIVGVEGDFSLLQWQFASVAKNPILDAVLDAVHNRINSTTRGHVLNAKENARESIKRVLSRTGPDVWSSAIIGYISEYGEPKGWNPGSTWPRAFNKSKYELIREGQFLNLSRPFSKERIGLVILPYQAWGCYRVRGMRGSCPNVNKGELSNKPHASLHAFAGGWKKEIIKEKG